MVLPLAGNAEAAYHAHSDTGIEALDYIENQHRAERENRLTDEQKKLLQDAKDMEKHLRQPLDTTKPSPIAFEGDDLTYDERDGSFIAKGKVNILQMDAHRFEGDEVTGNTQTHDIHIPGKAHVLQATPGQMRITMDGYKANYNYEKKAGDMQNGKGKVGAHYITGKRFEFYPDHFVVYDGTETKCAAKKPDYHLSAEKITYYPDDKMVMEHAKFWLKGAVLFSRKHYETAVGAAAERDRKYPYPRFGYNSDDKAYVKWDLTFPLRQNLDFDANILITGEDGWRSNYDVTWNNRRGMETGVTYGYFEDGDDNWIKKEPSVFWHYGHPIGRTHLNYGLKAEYGRWYGMENGIHSNHGEYGVGLTRDPIRFHRYALHLGTGYSITRESYDDSRVDGINADAVLTKDFNDRWSAYTGYHYNKKRKENSLFDFDTDDFSKRWENGFSYRIDDKNRVAMGTRYDMDHSRWDKIDYYWFHDMHCSQFVVRYKSMSNGWHISWDFTPW